MRSWMWLQRRMGAARGGMVFASGLCGAACAWLAACGSGSTAPSPGAAAACQSAHQSAHWVGAWASPPQATTLLSLSGTAGAELEADLLAAQDIVPNLALAQVFNDQSLRMIVAPHLGGQSLRLHLGNRFQKSSLTLDGVYVGQTGIGAALVPGTNHPVTFNGKSQVTIAGGAEAVSDAVAITVQPFEDLSISFHIQGLLVPVDYHLTAQQISYLSDVPGSYGANESASAFSNTISSWYVLNAVDVLAPASTGAVVAFGDSITDGYLSRYNQNGRWPDDLARRFLADPAKPGMSVMDAGISGNYVASDNYVFGPSGVSRFADDAVSKAGVTDVILLEGINDISGAPNAAATADAIMAADRQIILQAHAAGLKILGATLTPAAGAKLAGAGGTGEPQALRQTVNTWIRTGGAFDGVVDFDAAVRDPDHPDLIAAQYDGGDHLHFNDAGYQAMANAVDLGAFQGTGCR